MIGNTEFIRIGERFVNQDGTMIPLLVKTFVSRPKADEWSEWGISTSCA